MAHSRHISSNCSLADAGSMCDSATQWKARSQAANQGYSQSSGMQMMSASARCRQDVLRAPGRSRSGGGAGWPASPSSHSSTLYRYSCLPHSSPANARRAIALSSSVWSAGITAS